MKDQVNKYKETCTDHPNTRSRTFSSEATGKCSKFRFLETVRSGGSFKLCYYKESCTDSNSKNRVSKHDVHESSVHDEDVPFLTKEAGNYSRLLNILNESIEDKCVDMENVHVFVNESSHSSWTELFGELEVENTNFE